MATLLSLRNRVRTRYEQDSTVRLTDSRLNDVINEGLEELAEATEYYESSASVTVLAGRVYYDLRSILSPRATKVTAIWNVNTSRWLKPLTITSIPWVEWEEVSGESTHYLIRGLHHLAVFPQGATGTLTVYYKAIPPALTADGDVPAGLPADSMKALEEYALYELYAQDGFSAPAMLHWQAYKEAEAELRKQVERRVERARTGRIGGRA